MRRRGEHGAELEGDDGAVQADGVAAKLRTAEADETTREREKAAAETGNLKITSADLDEDDSEALESAVVALVNHRHILALQVLVFRRVGTAVEVHAAVRLPEVVPQ